jgi:hypothetical protein
VKDNLLTLQRNPSLSIFDAAQLIGSSGHVVESVPISIFAAQKIKESSYILQVADDLSDLLAADKA